MCFTVNVTTPLSKTAVARWRLYIFPPPNVNHIQLFILKQCHGDGVAASFSSVDTLIIRLVAIGRVLGGGSAGQHGMTEADRYAGNPTCIIAFH
jgi:hypothetical protein